MARSALMDVKTLRGAVDITTTETGSTHQLEEIAEEHTVQVSWSVTSTRAITALTIDLEGSLDGTNWFQLASHALESAAITAKADMFHVTCKPVAYVRQKVSAITLSGTGTALLKILYAGV